MMKGHQTIQKHLIVTYFLIFSVQPDIIDHKQTCFFLVSITLISWDFFLSTCSLSVTFLGALSFL